MRLLSALLLQLITDRLHFADHQKWPQYIVFVTKLKIPLFILLLRVIVECIRQKEDKGINYQDIMLVSQPFLLFNHKEHSSLFFCIAQPILSEPVMLPLTWKLLAAQPPLQKNLAQQS